MEDEESDYKLNDYGSLAGLLKSKSKNTKLILSISVGVFIFFIASIILIIILSNSNNDNEEYDEDFSKYTLLGQINCSYSIQKISEKTKILSDEFKKESALQMIIDGKSIKYSKEYKFSSTGIHTIIFNIYEDISLDYMFKDIKDIVRIELNSEKNKNCYITSMISTFENCINLNFFLLNGMNTNKVLSAKKLFYGTNIDIINN